MKSDNKVNFYIQKLLQKTTRRLKIKIKMLMAMASDFYASPFCDLKY